MLRAAIRFFIRHAYAIMLPRKKILINRRLNITRHSLQHARSSARIETDGYARYAARDAT